MPEHRVEHAQGHPTQAFVKWFLLIPWNTPLLTDKRNSTFFHYKTHCETGTAGQQMTKAAADISVSIWFLQHIAHTPWETACGRATAGLGWTVEGTWGVDQWMQVLLLCPSVCHCSFQVDKQKHFQENPPNQFASSIIPCLCPQETYFLFKNRRIFSDMYYFLLLCSEQQF